MTHPLADASAHEEKPRWVLANRQLRPGVELADTSVFDDDRWDLAPAVLQHHWPTVTLYFDTVRHVSGTRPKSYAWPSCRDHCPRVSAAYRC